MVLRYREAAEAFYLHESVLYHLQDMSKSCTFSFFDNRRCYVSIDVDPNFFSGSRLRLNYNTGKRSYTLYDDKERAAVGCIERAWHLFVLRRSLARLAILYYGESRVQKNLGRFTMLPVELQSMVLERLSLMDLVSFFTICFVRNRMKK